jgi:hypothetical protein
MFKKRFGTRCARRCCVVLPELILVAISIVTDALDDQTWNTVPYSRAFYLETNANMAQTWQAQFLSHGMTKNKSIEMPQSNSSDK